MFCQPAAGCHPLLAGGSSGRCRAPHLQADPQAARLAAQWLAGDTAVFFHPSVPMTAMNTVSSGSAPARRRTTVPAARNKSWQSIMAVMAGM